MSYIKIFLLTLNVLYQREYYRSPSLPSHTMRVEPAGARPGHAALRREEGQEGGSLGHCQGLRHDR